MAPTIKLKRAALEQIMIDLTEPGSIQDHHRIIEDHQNTRNFQNPSPMNQAPPIDPPLHLVPQSIPSPILATIKNLAKKFAGIASRMNQLIVKRDVLNDHRTNGTIPKDLDYKFKKLFNKDGEADLKASLILQSINQADHDSREAIIVLRLEYDNRYTTVMDILTPILEITSCNLDLDLVTSTFDLHIRDTLMKYLLKQSADQRKKQRKSERFEAVQLEASIPAALSTKDLSRMTNSIKQLTKQVKDLQINKKNQHSLPKKVKGAPSKKPVAAPSTKQGNPNPLNKKSRNGKDKFTAGGKLSRGRNGN